MAEDLIERLLPASLTRRRLLRLGLAAGPVAVIASACGGNTSPSAEIGRTATSTSSSSTGRTLPATPACGDDDETPAITEGPFFESGSPERTNIRDGDGTALVVTGVVMSTTCQTLSNAKLDFWHANADGEYDNEGYNFRGHQFTDDAGRFHLETIVPAIYPGRTRHIHVKVQPDGGSVLTTQLYFPNTPQNDGDDLFNAATLMNVTDVSDGKAATFDFVIEA
jgi:protocatechuate 3,4-dioxygenase beta subunit